MRQHDRAGLVFDARQGPSHSMKPYWYGGFLSDRIQAVARIMNLYPDYATLTGRNCRITLFCRITLR